MIRWLSSFLILELFSIFIVFSNAAFSREETQVAYDMRQPCNTCLHLVPSGMVNQQKNPIYLLRVYYQGYLLYTFETVSGRNFSQQRNRHQLGTEAPLPDGKYIIQGSEKIEEKFIRLHPQFLTKRGILGIHHDLSYGKDNGEDGTRGCIGLSLIQHFNILLKFVEMNKPQILIVDIQ